MPGEDGKQKIVYSGIVKVVVTVHYDSYQTSMLPYYILCQIYNEDDVPLDVTLQNQLNGGRLIYSSNVWLFL